jgi:hypothetical protein
MSFGRSTSTKPALRHVTNRYGARQQGRTTFLRTTSIRAGGREGKMEILGECGFRLAIRITAAGPSRIRLQDRLLKRGKPGWAILRK